MRLPDEIGGAPVTALGSYALSERAPDLTGRDTFRVRVTCGGPEPMHDANAIRAVTLPAELRSVGGHAFYNCRRLKRLTLTGTVRDFGGDPLMNCHALHEIRLLADPSGPTCLRKILGEYMANWTSRSAKAAPKRGCCFRHTARCSNRSRPRTSSSGASTARATATANALRAACSARTNTTARCPACWRGTTLRTRDGSPCGGWPPPSG